MLRKIFRNLCWCFFLMAAMAGAAFGQSGTASCTGTNTPHLESGTCTVTLGNGKLTYSYSDRVNLACSDPKSDNNATYEIDDLSSFSYTDPTGFSSGLPWTFLRYLSSGTKECPVGTSYPASVEVALTANIADFGTALTFIPKFGSASITTLDVGSLSPKFEVLAVIYAPPGSASNVAYGSSTMAGVTNSFASSFTNASTESESVTLKDTDIPGILGSSVSATESTGFTQTTTSSGSLAVNKSATNIIQINGPLNSAAGVDHTYDQITIWLNPVLEIAHYNNNVIFGQGGFDPRDPTGEIDQITLFVKDLQSLMNGTFTGDPDIPIRLARSWAGTGQGFTTADYAAVLARDPFANGATTIDPTRFQLTGQNFNYLPPPVGGQPDKETLMLNYTMATTESEMATDSYSVGTTTDVSASFLSFLTLEMKSTSMLTWTSSATQQVTEASGQTATLMLTGPPAGYTGPTNLVVYADNIYGTFMFDLIP